jgi:diguanylate cyclase (GGDEF)-like protein
MSKIRTIYINIIVLFFTFFFIQANAKTLAEQLNHAEYLIHQDVKSAIPLLKSLHPQIQGASHYDVIRWIFLSLDSAVYDFNYDSAKELYQQSTTLLSEDIPHGDIWRQLAESGLFITQDKYNQFLSHLESMEDSVMASKDVRLIAYFNRLLHYAYLFQGITDLALDTALQNRIEWIQLEESYYALEMHHQITEIYIIIGNVAGAKQALSLMSQEAKKLNLKSFLLSKAQFEAKIMAITGEEVKGYETLNKLITEGTVVKKDDQYLNIISTLAYMSYDLGFYQDTIKNARIILAEDSKAIAIKVLLAKALIKEQEFNEAAGLIAQAEKVFIDEDYKAGLFEIDNAKMDISYQRNDIKALYQSSKRLVDHVINFNNQQDQEFIRLGEKRAERAHIVANADQQGKVVDALSKSNDSQKKQILESNELIITKNIYLYVLSVITVVFLILVIWLVILFKQVKKLANTDSLTGIDNRRAGLKKARTILKSSTDKKSKHVVAIAMMDLDRFKNINDTYGHDIGDKVIQVTVNTTNVLLSKYDVFCRMGGEEFMLVIVGESKQQVIDKLNNIRVNIYQFNTQTMGLKQQISASFGVSFTDTFVKGKTIKDYLIDADTALYEAKVAGRNKVISH